MSKKFELDNFATQPSVGQLDICRKDDLFLIADFYQIKVPRGAVKQEIKEVIYKHLVEHGVLSEESEAGVADRWPVSVGKGAEYPEPEEMAGMDPVDLPPSTDPRLAIRLQELDLELSKQRYQSQLLHTRTVEIESHRAIKLKELELELRNKSPGRPTAADALGVSMPAPLPINASTPSPIPAPRRNQVSQPVFDVSRQFHSYRRFERARWILILRCLSGLLLR